MLVVFVSALFVLYTLFIVFAYCTSQENYEYESSRRKNKEDGWVIFGILDFASNQQGILLPSLPSTKREHESCFLIEYFTHISRIEKLLFIVQTFDFIFDLLFWINIQDDFKAAGVLSLVCFIIAAIILIVQFIIDVLCFLRMVSDRTRALLHLRYGAFFIHPINCIQLGTAIHILAIESETSWFVFLNIIFAIFTISTDCIYASLVDSLIFEHSFTDFRDQHSLYDEIQIRPAPKIDITDTATKEEMERAMNFETSYDVHQQFSEIPPTPTDYESGHVLVAGASSRGDLLSPIHSVPRMHISASPSTHSAISELSPMGGVNRGFPFTDSELLIVDNDMEDQSSDFVSSSRFDQAWHDVEIFLSVPNF